MINRTKLSVIAVSAVLAVALTGCGGSASSAPSSVSSASASAPVSDAASPAVDTAENGTADLDSAVETLLAANPISNQFEIAAMNIEYDFGLKAEDVFQFHPVAGDDAGLHLGSGERQMILGQGVGGKYGMALFFSIPFTKVYPGIKASAASRKKRPFSDA